MPGPGVGMRHDEGVSVGVKMVQYPDCGGGYTPSSARVITFFELYPKTNTSASKHD